MKAVILAGGLGSRMGNAFPGLPKPMVPLCGKPVLERQIEALRKNGIDDFTIVTCLHHEVIERYFGCGEKSGVNIDFFVESTPLGTAGALFKIRPESDFLFLNGDLLFDFDLQRMREFHKSTNALITLFTHPNNHPADSSVVFADGSGKVTAFYDKTRKPENYPNLCNAGIQIVSPEIFDYLSFESAADFDGDVVTPLVKSGRIYSYKSAEYVFDIGTPSRLEKAESDLENGMVKSIFKEKRKAVFLDRDGTINVHRDYITDPSQMELLDGAAQAINRFHELGYLVIVITNQPVVAKGMCTFETLNQIHNRLEMLLGEQGAYLDGIYFCPHHPKRGFEGEVKELKIECDCRKPKPGLILKAARDFNIDLSASFMAGDSERDVLAGINAGCESVFINENGETVQNAPVYKNIFEFSQIL
jgi:D-glycero-D-manno-heptose 1,7-bisphosphate phosphatase